MSLNVSAVPASTAGDENSGSRHVAKFRPSVWGDHFLSSYASHTTMKQYYELKKQVEEVKREVKNILIGTMKKISERLKLIDSIQRLGVSYHFKTEIDELLEQIYNSNELEGDDLNVTSLRFRLLRQQGYNISSDIFKRFKDKNGEFNKSLKEDAEGLLSLYEAANMRVHGEDILDEALDFTTTHLEAIVGHLSSYSLAAEINHALTQPIRKGLVRLRAKHYMSVYEEDPSHYDVLLNFARLDFNMLQKLHQKEISDLSRWWKDLNLNRGFARDRPVEAYFWVMQVYYEPQYSLGRKILTKVMILDSILDDIYDAYGTFEELQLLTDAIERWDINAIHHLPDYMKLFYQALLDLFEEVELEMKKKGKQYCIFYAKKAIKEQVRAFFTEAKWFKEGYTPKLEEYLENASESCGYRMLSIISFLGMDDIVTPEAYKWADNNPKIIRASAIICRLMDDIVSHKFEQERGHVVSAVECYMKEDNNWGSEEEIYDKFRRRIEDSWKDVNESCLDPIEVQMEILIRVLNLARVMDLLYKYEDGYTNNDGATKLYVKSLLVDSLPM